MAVKIKDLPCVLKVDVHEVNSGFVQEVEISREDEHGEKQWVHKV